ncbi:hypothetical protein G443_003237 [Actinoalloteichus cyanogriseus DSM 43889]|uniref:Uncharacterized protein n=1 Tax=Actinoalloteichus caeruleus DSM 43889 TaxID=1120930 RepID=A0ABT1JKD0_ACTCY|nr:hypothetical protein [Actinoalloteichus caeruleus DSM 43889]
MARPGRLLVVASGPAPLPPGHTRGAVVESRRVGYHPASHPGGFLWLGRPRLGVPEIHHAPCGREVFPLRRGRPRLGPSEEAPASERLLPAAPRRWTRARRQPPPARGSPAVRGVPSAVPGGQVAPCWFVGRPGGPSRRRGAVRARRRVPGSSEWPAPAPGWGGRRGSPARQPFLSVRCPRLRAVGEIRRAHTCTQPRSGEIQTTSTLCMTWVQLPPNLWMDLWTTRATCGQSVDEEDSSTVKEIHPPIHPQAVHTPSCRVSRDNEGYPHNPQPLLRALHFSLEEKKKEKQGVGTSRSAAPSESPGRAAPPSRARSQALRWCPAPRLPAARAQSVGLAPSASSIRPDCRLPWWTAISGAPVMIATARKDAR